MTHGKDMTQGKMCLVIAAALVALWGATASAAIPTKNRVFVRVQEMVAGVLKSTCDVRVNGQGWFLFRDCDQSLSSRPSAEGGLNDFSNRSKLPPAPAVSASGDSGWSWESGKSGISRLTFASVMKPADLRDLYEAARRLEAATGTISGTIEQNQSARSKA